MNVYVKQEKYKYSLCFQIDSMPFIKSHLIDCVECALVTNHKKCKNDCTVSRSRFSKYWSTVRFLNESPEPYWMLKNWFSNRYRHCSYQYASYCVAPTSTQIAINNHFACVLPKLFENCVRSVKKAAIPEIPIQIFLVAFVVRRDVCSKIIFFLFSLSSIFIRFNISFENILNGNNFKLHFIYVLTMILLWKITPAQRKCKWAQWTILFNKLLLKIHFMYFVEQKGPFFVFCIHNWYHIHSF